MWKDILLFFCIFSELPLLCSFSDFKCVIENLKFLQVKQELAFTWMHYVINLKISHGRTKYSCRCPIKLWKLCDMVYCAAKKTRCICLSSRSNRCNRNLLSILICILSAEWFSLAVSTGRVHRPKWNLHIRCVLACMEYVTDRDQLIRRRG